MCKVGTPLAERGTQIERMLNRCRPFLNSKLRPNRLTAAQHDVVTGDEAFIRFCGVPAEQTNNGMDG